MQKERPAILFSPIAIEAASATTPAWLNATDIFNAAIEFGAPRVASHGADDFDVLTKRALQQLNAPADARLLLATTKGDIARQVPWMREADTPEGPGAALHPLSAALAGHHNAGYAISTACTSGIVALIEAALHITEGAAESIVALGADVATDFVHDGFHALRAVSATACRPFDKHRDGLALGSAAAACLLTATPSATPLAYITGFGISNDAAHMTAPDRHAAGLIRAIEQALRRANLQPADIDVVFAHGTATPYNDAMETLAMEKIFLGSNARPAITAMKGLLGHTLGAAGLIECVLAIEMLKAQLILPITGLQMPERDDIHFVRVPRQARIRHILKIASGFGGMNAAVILSHPNHVVRPVRGLPSEGTLSHVAGAVTATDDSLHTLPGRSAYASVPADLRSSDPLANIALGAVHALLHAIPAEKRADIGLILGTTLGSLETDREFDRSRRAANARYASPAAFSRTLPSTIAAEIALRFGLTGPSLVLSAGDASAATALRRAIGWMRHFNLDYCIAGGLDWTGPNVGLPAIPPDRRVAFILLTRHAHGAMATLRLGEPAPINFAALRDDSLYQLSGWIQNPESIPPPFFSAGISLTGRADR